MEFYKMCDDLCFNPELWPQHMRDMYTKVQRAMKRHYGRWDFDPNEACIYTIDLWKNATGNVTNAVAETFVISHKGTPTKDRRRANL
jgi:hypothetical protein